MSDNSISPWHMNPSLAIRLHPFHHLNCNHPRQWHSSLSYTFIHGKCIAFIPDNCCIHTWQLHLSLTTAFHQRHLLLSLAAAFVLFSCNLYQHSSLATASIIIM
jgi:hypothetical protein